MGNQAVTSPSTSPYSIATVVTVSCSESPTTAVSSAQKLIGSIQISTQTRTWRQRAAPTLSFLPSTGTPSAEPCFSNSNAHQGLQGHAESLMDHFNAWLQRANGPGPTQNGLWCRDWRGAWTATRGEAVEGGDTVFHSYCRHSVVLQSPTTAVSSPQKLVGAIQISTQTRIWRQRIDPALSFLPSTGTPSAEPCLAARMHIRARGHMLNLSGTLSMHGFSGPMARAQRESPCDAETGGVPGQLREGCMRECATGRGCGRRRPTGGQQGFRLIL